MSFIHTTSWTDATIDCNPIFCGYVFIFLRNICISENVKFPARELTSHLNWFVYKYYRCLTVLGRLLVERQKFKSQDVILKFEYQITVCTIYNNYRFITTFCVVIVLFIHFKKLAFWAELLFIITIRELNFETFNFLPEYVKSFSLWNRLVKNKIFNQKTFEICVYKKELQINK